MNTAEIRALRDAHLTNNYVNIYQPQQLAMVRGEGMSLWDAEGREYLDMFAGIAVTNLGHCHPEVTRAIQEQAAKLVHVSNLYYIEPQVKLAALLSKHSFADRWFFCNSGAEANEAAIKLSRRYWAQKGTPRPTIITARQSFHGRTMATMSATGQPKHQEGFAPLLEGFKYVDYENVDELEKAITPDVGAILLEPIQGEGGVRIPSPDYLKNVRAVCDTMNTLLILDEVQTGLGRTGALFGYMRSDITPDIFTLAKGLGNGVPIGAMGCTHEVASGFGLGSHASTFGGNPLCSAAALATCTILTETDLIEKSNLVSAYFKEHLDTLKQKHECITEIRMCGLMIGIEMTKSIAPLITKMLDEGIICGPAGAMVLRFLPALILEKEHVDKTIAALDKVLGEF